ncbi:MAG TPA: OadG family protein [Candidatus Onthenecus intestinigallinarum]|uniref:OadG family protein n=1 Tax=Candidatus Onthenecus intestinigallinarum TaxID=2840875 RepID=A0A9D1CQZ9_9FIRM|nr:OadG family protein [Candidatus Onthenecus intestinigallinarum]
MTTILYGLQVTIVGLVVVFVGLIILIGCINLMQRCMAEFEKKKIGTPKTQPEAAPAPAAAAPAVPASQANDGELMAVITAAVAAMLSEEKGAPVDESGFVVRAVRRVSNAPAWNRAGREEQVYSRL